MHKVLIIDDVHPLLLENLQKDNIAYDYYPEIDRPGVLDIIAQYTGLVVRSKTRIDAELIHAGTKLKFIARAGSGMDNVDETTAQSKGIQLINVPEANSDAVGEHTVGMLLMLLNHLNRADQEVRNHIWKREANRGMELKGKTVAIIGYGHTGMAVAKKLSGFDCRLIAYDKYKNNFTDNYVSEVDMATVFQEADIISFHIPLTDETFYLVNDDYINMFSKNIVLLNLSRGKVVKLNALVEAIRKGKIVASGLDVLENERLDTLSVEQQRWFDYLIHSNQTVLTPHIGGWTNESYEKISFFLSNKISYLANGLEKKDLKM